MWRFSSNGRFRARETGSHTEQATCPNPSISVAQAYFYAYSGCYAAAFWAGYTAKSTSSLSVQRIMEAPSSESSFDQTKHTDAG